MVLLCMGPVQTTIIKHGAKLPEASVFDQASPDKFKSATQYLSMVMQPPQRQLGDSLSTVPHDQYKKKTDILRVPGGCLDHHIHLVQLIPLLKMNPVQFTNFFLLLPINARFTPSQKIDLVPFSQKIIHAVHLRQEEPQHKQSRRNIIFLFCWVKGRSKQPANNNIQVGHFSDKEPRTK